MKPSNNRFKLTTSSVRKRCKPPESDTRNGNGKPVSRLFHWDTELKGFALLASRTSRTFILQKDLLGKSKRVTIGRHPAWTPDAARKRAMELTVQMDMGVDPNKEAREARANGTTLDEAIDWHQTAMKAKRCVTRSIATIRKEAERHLSDWLRRPLSSIGRNECARRHERITAASGPYAANRALHHFRAVYNTAMRRLEDLPPCPTVAVTFSETVARTKGVDLASVAEEHGRALQASYRDVLGPDVVDSVHDLSRLIRLPFTINYPSARKIAKGRGIALASVVAESPSPRIDISAFSKWTKTMGSTSTRRDGASSGAATVPRRFESVDALERYLRRKLPRDLRNLIACGHPAGQVPRGDRDRSADAYRTCCDLARLGADDSTILRVISDARFPNSDHIIAQPDAGRAARRAVAAARDATGPFRPGVVYAAGRLPQFVSELQDALTAAGLGIYQRGNALVRVLRTHAGSAGGGRSELRIREVDDHWLKLKIAEAARVLIPETKAAGMLRESNPIVDHARLIQVNAGAWLFPVLRDVVSAPTLRVDGSVLQDPGYEVASQLYLDMDPSAFPPVAEEPTRDDAIAAFAEFDEVLGQFPFESSASKAVALSAILSGLVCRSLPTIPLHAFDAPAAGTGKSLICEAIGLLVLGARPPAMSQGKNAEEDEKRINSALREGRAVIWIDNVEKPVQGDPGTRQGRRRTACLEAARIRLPRDGRHGRRGVARDRSLGVSTRR